jgi:hypothetical protein
MPYICKKRCTEKGKGRKKKDRYIEKGAVPDFT